MGVFYIIVTVLSAVTLAVDLILRSTEKIRWFGAGKRLTHFRPSLVPIDKFLPETVTMLEGAALTLGAAGLLFFTCGFGAVLSLFCAACSALLVCFIVQYAGGKLRGRLLRLNPPVGDKLSGLAATVYEEIPGDGWGKISLRYKGRRYIKSAMSANETDIAKGERVLIVTEEDGVCFVERESELYDVLNEKRGN